VFAELCLNDLVEAAIDAAKTVMHLFAEAADLNTHLTDLIVYVAADALTFFLDETRKLVELGFLFCHAGQYTIPIGLRFTNWRVLVQ
jgi:hypothetical protein